MNRYLSLILIGALTGCCGSSSTTPSSECGRYEDISPKFKYRDKVKITSGFYTGVEAEIIESSKNYLGSESSFFGHGCYEIRYLIDTDEGSRSQKIRVTEKDLVGLNGAGSKSGIPGPEGDEDPAQYSALLIDFWIDAKIGCMSTFSERIKKVLTDYQANPNESKARENALLGMYAAALHTEVECQP